MKTRIPAKLTTIFFLVLAALIFSDSNARATTVFHLPLPTTNYLPYTTQLTLAGTPSDSTPFVAVDFILPLYNPINPDSWTASFSVDITGGSWEAYLIYIQSPFAVPPNRDVRVGGFYIPTSLPLVLDLFSEVVNYNVEITGGEFAVNLILPDGVTVTPIPSTLPLFATGLGALGLITWRRKRKNNRGT